MASMHSTTHYFSSTTYRNKKDAEGLSKPPMKININKLVDDFTLLVKKNSIEKGFRDDSRISVF